MANTRYENCVLENKLKDQLITGLNMLDYATVDDRLTSEAGMTRKVHVYKATGSAEKVAEGEGNTQSIEMSYEAKEYDVGTTQARFIYTDEDEMGDPFLTDSGIRNISVALINSVTDDIIAEYEKATQVVEYSGNVAYDDFVDAIAKLNLEDGEEEGALVARCNPSMKAMLRKALKDDLKYVEDHVRSGYIGTVCGVPVRGCKAIPDGKIVLSTKRAVTYFRKKDVEIEQERDANLRRNTLYGRLVGFAALTDEGQCVVIQPAA